MKAIQVTEGTQIPMTRGSIVLIFDPKEIDVAIHACEYLANALEERARIRCGTEELWDFAILMRKYNEKYNKRVKPCSPHTWGLYFTMKKVKNYLQLLKEAHQRHPGDFSYSEGKKKFKSQKNSYVSVKGGIIDSEETQFYGKEKNNKIINP